MLLLNAGLYDQNSECTYGFLHITVASMCYKTLFLRTHITVLGLEFVKPTKFARKAPDLSAQSLVGASRSESATFRSSCEGGDGSTVPSHRFRKNT